LKDKSSISIDESKCQLPVVVQVLAVDGLEGDSHEPGRDAILDWQHVQGVKG